MMNSKVMLSLLTTLMAFNFTSLMAQHSHGQDDSRDHRDRDYYNLYWQNKQNIQDDRINRNETTDHIPYYQTEWYENNR